MVTNRAAGGIGGLALVLVGVAIGIGADRLWLSHQTDAMAPHESHDMALEHMQQMFDLDQRQIEQIDEIFRRHQSVVAASWSQVEPSLRTAIESVHLSMMNVLRPDQIEAFNAWLHEQGSHEIHQAEHTEDHSGAHSPDR